MRLLNLFNASLFSAVIALAYCLKSWYSQTTVVEMQWIFKPLVVILECLIPGEFQQNWEGEWFHAGWQILLVKGCSGMNFFIMSFVCYSLVFGFKYHGEGGNRLFLLLAFIGLAGLAAWITTLFVNTIRIMLAMSLVRYPELVEWSGFSGEGIHRLAGLFVYFPALYIQTQISPVFNRKSGYLLSFILITAMLIVVPMLTGNAFERPEAFKNHVIAIFSFLALTGLVVTCVNVRSTGYINFG